MEKRYVIKVFDKDYGDYVYVDDTDDYYYHLARTVDMALYYPDFESAAKVMIKLKQEHPDTEFEVGEYYNVEVEA